MALNLTLKNKLIAFGAFNLLVIAVLVGSSARIGNTLDATFRNYAAGMEAVNKTVQTDMAHDAVRGDVLAFLLAKRAKDEAAEAEARRALVEHGAGMRELIEENTRAATDAETRALLGEAGKSVEQYLKTAAAVIEAGGQGVAAAEAALPAFLEQFKHLEGGLAATSERIESAAEAARKASDESADFAHLVQQLVGGGAALTALLVLFLLGRNILRVLGGEPSFAVEVANRVAQGDMDTEIPVRSGDSGSIIAALARMQKDLRERLTRERAVAAESLRVRVALDNSSTIVAIADTEDRII